MARFVLLIREDMAERCGVEVSTSDCGGCPNPEPKYCNECLCAQCVRASCKTYLKLSDDHRVLP